MKSEIFLEDDENKKKFWIPQINDKYFKFSFWDQRDKEWLQDITCNYDEVLSNLALPSVTTSSNSNSNSNSSINIPKIIHQIWLGSPLPEKFKQLQRTWQEKHPEWEYILWTDEDEDIIENKFELKDNAAFQNAKNFGEKSDILRYKILQSYGGLYVDVDMECISSFDDLHHFSNISFYCGISNTKTIEVNNGLIGCCPHHPIIIELNNRISEYKALPPPEIKDPVLNNLFSFLGTADNSDINNISSTLTAAVFDNPMNTIERTGPGLLTRVLIDYNFQKKIMKTDKIDNTTDKEKDINEDVSVEFVAPPSWFYAIPNNVGNIIDGYTNDNDDDEKANMIKSKYITKDSRSIHFWAKSWQ